MDSFFGDGIGDLPCSQPLLPLSVLVCMISCSSGLGLHDLRRLLGDFKTAPPRRHSIQHLEGPVLAASFGRCKVTEPYMRKIVS